MALKENTVFDAKTPEYTQSNQSFKRVPNLLYALGALGEVTPSGALSLSGAAFLQAAKDLKITRPTQLIDSLSGYGLSITGAGKAIAPGDTLLAEYADNRMLLTALSSMAGAMLAINKQKLNAGNDLFYSMNIKLLSTPLGKAPKLTIDDFCHVLSPENRLIARRFDAMISPYAKAVVRQSGIMRNDWGCVYTLSSTKKIVLTLNSNQSDMAVKMNLANIGGYTDALDAAPESLRDSILTAWECGHCNPGCAGGFAFSYQGKAYNKCRGGAFQFPSVKAEDVDDCLTLLGREVAATA